jgi:phosphatidylserine decarboxylase
MAAADTPGFGERCFVALQYLLPQHFLSRIVLRATRSEHHSWKNWLIRRFVGHFEVNMSEATQPDPYAYASFNHFFTRALRAGARPGDAASNAIVSPVDGTVSAAGAIEGDRLLQAKGHDYSLEELLAGDTTLVQEFRGGRFATLYLAPYNYHRIHMPLSGVLRTTIHVPGRLFSVNTATAALVPRLFARNERVICVFDTEFGSLAVILVGALFVGSMATVWAGDITPRRGARPSRLAPPPQRVRLERGAELGRFNMGSTVILLLPGNAHWTDSLVAGSLVRVGETIGNLGVTGSSRPS